MKLERFVLGHIGTNCYLLENEERKEVVIVDPATCPDEIIGHVKRKGLTPKAILLTHGHYDHVMGIDRWVAEFGIPVYLHEEEKEVLELPKYNLSRVFGYDYSYKNVEGLNDGQEIELAGITIRVIHTPGHTKGGCCYYIADAGILLSGDTLFAQSVGRNDFPTGSMSMLVRSIKEKLFLLPDDTVVYPGHGEETSIGEEKQKNPFV